MAISAGVTCCEHAVAVFKCVDYAGNLVSDGEKRRGPRDSDQAVGSLKQSLLATPVGVL